MKKCLLTFASALLCLGAWAQEPVEKTFNVVADTWIRTDNGGSKNGSGNIVELRTTAIADSEDFNIFVALFGFEFERPEGMKVQSATLRLVTERVKAGPVSVHGYSHDFTEGDACWNVEKDYAEPLLAAEPLTQFDVAGQYPKAIWDGGVNEDKQNVAAWTNNVDVTTYVKTLTSNVSRANFMLHLPVDKVCEQVCFYTKDNTGLDLTEKYNYTATAEELSPALIVTFVEDADTNNDAIEPTADTWVRSDNGSHNKSSETAIEICYQMNDDGSGRNKEFYGIMSFKMPADVVDGTYEVTSARLRLVHEMIKGDRNMEIYAYPAAIDEANVCWNTEAGNIAATLATEPIATYVANGQGNKAMWDGDITENFRTAEAWTNIIDLTEYIKANPADLNILISKRDATPGNSIKISSKETVGQVNSKKPDDIFSYAADDLKPILYLTYTKVSALDKAPAPVASVEGNVISLSCEEGFSVWYAVTASNEAPEAGAYQPYENGIDVESFGNEVNYVWAIAKGEGYVASDPVFVGVFNNGGSEEGVIYSQVESAEQLGEGYSCIIVVEKSNGEYRALGKNMKGVDVKINNGVISAFKSDFEATEFQHNGGVLTENGAAASRAAALLLDGLKVMAGSEQLGYDEASDSFSTDGANKNLMLFTTGSNKNTGVDEVAVDNESAPVEYYNLQGVRVENPSNGLYIKRQGSKVEKVIIR